MLKPNIKKMIDRKNELPPPPLLINKDKLIIDINNKLVEEKAGPESVILLDIKNPRRTWITYEYHLDIIYKIGDKQFTMLPNNYYDESNYPIVFEDQLYNRLAKVQQSINRGI
jgi:hypothetical protein